MTLRGRETCTFIHMRPSLGFSPDRRRYPLPPHSMASHSRRTGGRGPSCRQAPAAPLPVLIVGPDPALSPTQYGVSIGPQAAGDLRLGQARLFLEPLEPLRE